MSIEEVLAILKNLTAMGASPGGLALLANLFTDHGLTLDKTAQAVKAMPEAPPPKEK